MSVYAVGSGLGCWVLATVAEQVATSQNHATMIMDGMSNTSA